MSQRSSASVESGGFTYPVWQLVLKRLLDFPVALILLVLISPLWLVIVLWIRSDSEGPAIFTQTRVGLGGRSYKIYKFRTMVQNADAMIKEKLEQVKDLEGFVFQDKDDPRITRSGRFLRKTSLDELPQLWSIFTGDMSFVGPRPALFNQDDLIALRTQAGVHELVPGLTGWAQVNGRDELPIPAKVALDVEYLQQRSFAFDLRILWLTFVKVLRKEGVSH